MVLALDIWAVGRLAKDWPLDEGVVHIGSAIETYAQTLETES
jgi:hypothetical protein